MPWAKPCHSPLLMPGSSLSSRPSKSILGNETTNHCGSVSPILQWKKHIQWHTFTFTDMFYVRINKLISWVNICKHVLWWFLLSSRDLFSVLITGGHVYSVEKQTLRQTLLEDRNVITAGYSGAPEHAGMVQPKNSPTNSTFRLIKLRVIAMHLVNWGAELSSLQCTPLHSDTPESTKLWGAISPLKIKINHLDGFKKKCYYWLRKTE